MYHFDSIANDFDSIANGELSLQYAHSVRTGNHDTTLDPPFFHGASNKFKWPTPQDTEACRALLLNSQSITYLENEAATFYLAKTHTYFKVYGSPYSSGRRGWAFQYWGKNEAEQVWANKGMNDADIVVTHTPVYGVVDVSGGGERAGCEVLARRLGEIRPVMHVCGHIHDARGVEKARWRTRRTSPTPLSSTTPPSSTTDEAPASTLSPVDSSTHWTDPGIGTKKIALVDLTKKGWAIDNCASGGVTRHILSDSTRVRLSNEPQAAVVEYQPGAAASSLVDGALLNEAGVECEWRRKAGGAIECRWGRGVGGDVHASTSDRTETVMINAAFLGQRVDGKPSKVLNKPIVVDVELPVWESDSEA
jgi:hypothetical protein